MPATLPISVRPVTEQTVYINMNKINKHLKSKQGLEAAKRYEDNLRLIDFWHPESAKDVQNEAFKSLQGYVNAVFTTLNPYEKSILVEQVKANINTLMNSKINDLDGVELYNVGKASDKVLECAMERDRHLTTIEGILNEAKRGGQTKLNGEQTRVVEAEMKQAVAWDEKRKEYADAMVEAKKKNEEIARSKGPKVYAAYIYLYQMPETFSKKIKK